MTTRVITRVSAAGVDLDLAGRAFGCTWTEMRAAAGAADPEVAAIYGRLLEQARAQAADLGLRRFGVDLAGLFSTGPRFRTTAAAVAARPELARRWAGCVEQGGDGDLADAIAVEAFSIVAFDPDQVAEVLSNREQAAALGRARGARVADRTACAELVGRLRILQVQARSADVGQLRAAVTAVSSLLGVLARRGELELVVEGSVRDLEAALAKRASAPATTPPRLVATDIDVDQLDGLRRVLVRLTTRARLDGPLDSFELSATGLAAEDLGRALVAAAGEIAAQLAGADEVAS